MATDLFFAIALPPGDLLCVLIASEVQHNWFSCESKTFGALSGDAVFHLQENHPLNQTPFFHRISLLKLNSRTEAIQAHNEITLG